MAVLNRDDGAKIHWEARGEGPAVVLASYWSWNPEVYADLFADLASDHRVVTYHLRGTGQSSRRGPYEMEVDAADLEAVLDAAGQPATLLATADSANRAVKVAARRPDLVGAVVCLGTAPIARQTFAGREGMLGSDSVIEAFLEMLDRDYRGATRTLMTATNTQMTEEEVRARVDTQTRFCPQEAAVGRVRAWTGDDPRDDARQLGDRLWIFRGSGIAGQWLPPDEELNRLVAEMLPRARVVELEPGPVSRPDLAAKLLREVTAPLREAAARQR